MITFKKITWENLDQCLKLEVADNQKTFVGSNEYSLAQAYVALEEGKLTVMPFAVYAGDTMIGFIMMTYSEEHEFGGGPSYTIARLMLDKQFQSRGYGMLATHEAIDYIRTFPKGAADSIYLSYEADNKVARALYTSCGFVETGQVDEEGELVAVLNLKGAE